MKNLAEDCRHLTSVDYGAGSGLICLIAKGLGFGRVVYVDIYEGSVKDARVLGQSLALPGDEYVHGNLRDLILTFSRIGLEANALVSHDCLEHIYDVDDFLGMISKIPLKQLKIWLSSAANPLRPKSRRKLTRVAFRAENLGQKGAWGDKLDKTLKPYRLVRAEIIRAEYPDLSAEVIELLAGLTRGLHEQHIRNAVSRYREMNVLPPKPEHPTNTCDPWSGNWAERLMNFF